MNLDLDIMNKGLLFYVYLNTLMFQCISPLNGGKRKLVNATGNKAFLQSITIQGIAQNKGIFLCSVSPTFDCCQSSVRQKMSGVGRANNEQRRVKMISIDSHETSTEQ